MSGDNFAARFLREQRAKGRELGPLFGVLESMAGNQSSTPESWMLSPAEIEQLGAKPTPTRRELGEFPMCRTVDDFTREKQEERRASQQAYHPTKQAATTARAEDFYFPVPASVQDAHAPVHVKMLFHLHPTASLTACLDSAEQPETARQIFRVLHELALISVRARGLPHAPTVAVFHLPQELLAAHLGVCRQTVFRNLKPMTEAGLLDVRDVYGRCRGQTAITGKVWAVAIQPEAVLSGQQERVKLRHHDLKANWRDLDADIEAGRTVWNITRTDEQKAAYKAQQEARAQENAQARARALERANEREAAKARGEKPLTGRKAAAANAKQTRAEKPRPTQAKPVVQQSLNSLKAVEKSELINWVLAGFNQSPDVTLTVARALSDGFDAIFTLPTLTTLSNHRRNAAVQETALTLAAVFEDTENLRFWCWLIWQLLRGYDQGQDYTGDVAHLLARILHDVKHDETMNARTVEKPAALVGKAISDPREPMGWLHTVLKSFAPTRVGGRPKRAA